MSDKKLWKIAGALNRIAYGTQIKNDREMDALVRRLNRNTGVPSADQMRARGVSDEEYARLKRGEEQYPLIAYHATPHSFDEFNRGDIGFHVGTAEQANGRIRDAFGPDAEARILPLRVDVRFPLTVRRDVGSWDRPDSVAEELLMTPQLRRALSLDDMEYLERVFNGSARSISDELNTRSSYHDNQMRNMRDMLRNYGYDSIRYPNNVENLSRYRSGDSPRLQNIHKRFSEKIDSAESDAERMRLLNRQHDVMNRFSEGVGKNDNYSWIVLDPQQLRLQNAAFEDPTSRNLLAGTAATAVGLASAVAEEKAKGGILRKVSKHA